MLPESQKATLILFPNKFQITGPIELISLTMSIVKSTSDNEELKHQMEAFWSNWYVLCAVTGKQILLNTLRYWDIDLQECYGTPDVVPNRYRHLPHDPRIELRDYWAKRRPERIASSC